MSKTFIILLMMMVNTYCQINFNNKKDEYIVGGKDAKIRDFPYNAFLKITKAPNTYYGCGGAYIREVWVLTAAHCIVVNDKTPPQVAKHDAVETVMGLERVGQKNLQRIRSVKLVAHSKYFQNRTHCFNDIGLVRIRNRFKITPEVKIGKLLLTAISSGSRVTAIGWGATKPHDTPMDITIPMTLQRVDLTVWKRDRCMAISKSKTYICVGENGKLPCYGDSGGPMVYKRMVVGVTSTGHNCSVSYAAYEGVYSHLSWIEKIIRTDGKRTSNAYNLRVTYIIFFVILCSKII